MLTRPANPFIERMKARQPAYGTLIFSSDPAITEIAGSAGFELILIDMEHAPLGFREVTDHVRAAQCAGSSCWVRVGRYDPADVGRILDAGAQGIVFPHFGMQPKIEAPALEAMRYAPAGLRPTCTGMRTSAYGNGDFAAYVAGANRDIVAVGLVEDKEVIDNIDRVLDASPIQAVMPGGAGDLASSLGVHGQSRHPSVLAAIRRVVEAARKRPGLSVGVYVSDVESVGEMLALKADFYVFSIDYKVLSRAFRDILAVLRAGNA